ncbi:hypothetical protein ONK29_27325, partial [Salmonella enterica subsp. enterica serovar Anatum]|nr:hypothetical protein [Salmonella enterica subsp. enterica serovar Anatum]
HMHYELAKDFVVLTGNAYLEQLDSNITGDKITYRVKEQKMQAPSYVAVAQAESPRFVNVAAEVAGPCSVDTAQSGTESFNCPD